MILLQTGTGVNFDVAIQNLINNLEPQIQTYVDNILPYSQKLGAAIILIYIGVKVVKMFLNPDNTIVPHILVRPILILGALTLYSPLVDLLLKTPVDIIGNILSQAGGTGVDTGFFEAVLHVQDSGGTLANSSGIYDILQANPFLEVVHLLIYFIASVAGAFIEFMALLVSNLYLVIGTIILPLAIVPGNEKVISKWFFGFLSVLLWIPILTIIKTIISFANGAAPQNFIDPLFSIAYQVVLIFFIFSVPKFANILVSQGSELGQSAVSSISGSAAAGMSRMGSMMRQGKKSSGSGSSPGYGKTGKPTPSYSK